MNVQTVQTGVQGVPTTNYCEASLTQSQRHPSLLFCPQGVRRSHIPLAVPGSGLACGYDDSRSSPKFRMTMASPAISKVIRSLFEGRASQTFFVPSIFLTCRLGYLGLSVSKAIDLRTPRFSGFVSVSYACSNRSVKRTSTVILCLQDI